VNLPDGVDPWAVWLGLAVALGVAELFSLDLILLMLATGAVVGMVTSLVVDAVWVQVLAAVIASVAALGVVRPSFVKRLHSGPDLVQGHEALVGRKAVVVEEISAQGGLIRVGGEDWTARPYDEDEVIEAGCKVDILQIKGATALVYKIPELDA
jgi:membrane protein implicated in regulation of membrane protease activity